MWQTRPNLPSCSRMVYFRDFDTRPVCLLMVTQHDATFQINHFFGKFHVHLLCLLMMPQYGSKFQKKKDPIRRFWDMDLCNFATNWSKFTHLSQKRFFWEFHACHRSAYGALTWCKVSKILRKFWDMGFCNFGPKLGQNCPLPQIGNFSKSRVNLIFLLMIPQYG